MNAQFTPSAPAGVAPISYSSYTVVIDGGSGTVIGVTAPW